MSQKEIEYLTSEMLEEAVRTNNMLKGAIQRWGAFLWPDDEEFTPTYGVEFTPIRRTTR